MRSGLDNFRVIVIFDIIKNLKLARVDVMVYELTLTTNTYEDMNAVNDLNKFKEISDVILANRYNSELDSVKDKIYTKDIYFRD